MLRRLIPILTGLVVVFLLTLLRIGDPFPVQVLREMAFDFYQRLHPRAGAPIFRSGSSISMSARWPSSVSGHGRATGSPPLLTG